MEWKGLALDVLRIKVPPDHCEDLSVLIYGYSFCLQENEMFLFLYDRFACLSL